MFKTTSPVQAFVMGLLMMALVFGLMMRLYQSAKSPIGEEEAPPVIKPFFTDKKLEPFTSARYTGAKTLDELRPALTELFELLKKNNRERLAEYLELQIPWKKALESPIAHIGAMLPLYPARVTLEARQDPGEASWLKVELKEGVSLRVLAYMVAKERLEAGGPFYLDCVYLGQAMENGAAVHLGMARELYELPGKGLFPVQENPETVFEEIIDETDFAEEARQVSRVAFYHLLGKVQRGMFASGNVLKGVGYNELMGNPDRFRGELVSFKGTLVYCRRRRLVGPETAPGMEYYYEGNLLNSDRVMYLFRSLKMPENLKVRDLVYLEGYFIQRYNFPNRLGKTTWIPLVIASRLEKTADVDYSIPLKYQLAASLAMAVVMGFMVFFILKGHRRNQQLMLDRRPAPKGAIRPVNLPPPADAQKERRSPLPHIHIAAPPRPRAGAEEKTGAPQNPGAEAEKKKENKEDAGGGIPPV